MTVEITTTTRDEKRAIRKRPFSIQFHKYAPNLFMNRGCIIITIIHESCHIFIYTWYQLTCTLSNWTNKNWLSIFRKSNFNMYTKSQCSILARFSFALLCYFLSFLALSPSLSLFPCMCVHNLCLLEVNSIRSCDRRALVVPLFIFQSQFNCLCIRYKFSYDYVIVFFFVALFVHFLICSERWIRA